MIRHESQNKQGREGKTTSTFYMRHRPFQAHMGFRRVESLSYIHLYIPYLYSSTTGQHLSYSRGFAEHCKRYPFHTGLPPDFNAVRSGGILK
jgi:hypothetical protein